MPVLFAIHKWNVETMMKNKKKKMRKTKSGFDKANGNLLKFNAVLVLSESAILYRLLIPFLTICFASPAGFLQFFEYFYFVFLLSISATLEKIITSKIYYNVTNTLYRVVYIGTLLVIVYSLYFSLISYIKCALNEKLAVGLRITYNDLTNNNNIMVNSGGKKTSFLLCESKQKVNKTSE